MSKETLAERLTGVDPNDPDDVPEQLLAARESLVPSTETSVGTGGEFDASDLAIPYVKIVQATSESGTPGKFWSSDGSEVDVLNMVVLHIQFTRTFYDGDAGKLICSSNDRVIGNVREPELMGDDAPGGQWACGGCIHFNDDPYSKPSCQKDYALTCLNIDTNEPFMFRVKGSAMGVFKYRLISAVAMGRKAPWFAAFEMTTIKRTNDRKQSWYAPELKPIQTYSADEQSQWAAMAGTYAQSSGPLDGVGGVDPDDLPFE